MKLENYVGGGRERREREGRKEEEEGAHALNPCPSVTSTHLA
jgi:hypothetical protein